MTQITVSFNLNKITHTIVCDSYQSLCHLRYCHKNNLNLNDKDGQSAALDSLIKLKEAGGQTVVEQSSHGFDRKASHLKRLSYESGLNIVAGTGYYIEESLSDEIIRKSTVESIANLCTTEILDGCMGDPTVKAGLIGEVGVSDDISGTKPLLCTSLNIIFLNC